MSEPKKNRIKIPVAPEVESDTAIEDVAEEKPKAQRKKVNTENKSKAKDQKPDEQKISLQERWASFVVFYSNERTQKILGLLFMLIAVYLAVAFTSFVFTWADDQDKVLGPPEEFFSTEVTVSNWLGKLGALVSHLFIHKWFGMASFFLVPIFLLSGLKKLINKDFSFLRRLNRQFMFYLVWGSVALGYVFSKGMYFLGGGFGYVMSRQLNSIIGGIGTGVLLVFSLLGFLVIMYNISFIAKKEDGVDEVEEEQEEEKPEVLVNKMPVFTEDELSKEEEEALMDIQVVDKVEEKKTIDFSEEPVIIEEAMIAEPEIKPEVIAVKNDGGVDFQIEQGPKEEILPEENLAQRLVEEFGEYDPTIDLGSYKFPTIDLLENYGPIETRINQEELNSNKNKILDTLKNYGIEIDKIKATIGPTVTLYEINPAAGVRISKIKNLEDDIALSLSALGIRIIAPIPGKGTIGIEVPNLSPEMVPMRNILSSEKFHNSGFDLPIALGKTISNETFIADLAKMPHLLMAGATGQGKSVGLNAILVSLLYKKHPSQIKFVLVDPKKVELTLFNKIERHFLAKLPGTEEAIITDTTKVVHTLNSLCIEMDNRYELLKDAMVRNIKEYNTKFVARKLNPNEGHKYLPYIVVVVDEFADLIMTAGKEVETPIARLAQLARAIGIHLIIATQRPSVNIITGVIKANFPARIAFRVTSKIDSRTILDSGGAEQLIGRGDMLLSTGNDLVRIQCAFVDTPEVEKITGFIGGQRGYPEAFMLPEYIDEKAEGPSDIDLSERDKMFDEAARIIVQHQQGSASLLQRKLKLGYNRAGRIVDQLEAAGIIGQFEGSKAREVLIKDLSHLDEILNALKNK